MNGVFRIIEVVGILVGAVMIIGNVISAIMRWRAHQKRLLCLAILLLGLGWSAMPAQASTEARCAQLSNVIKCENYDDGNAGSWPHGAGSSWIGSSGVGPVYQNLDPGWTSGTVFSELVSTTPCGARGRSLHMQTPGTGIGGTGFSDSYEMVISPAITEVRVRYNLCMATNMDTYFNPPGNEDGMHMYFLDNSTSGVGVRFDLFAYGNGETNTASDITITYNSTTYVVKHPYGPECGQGAGSRGYFNTGSPAGWSEAGSIFLTVNHNHGESAIGGAGGAGGPAAPNLCRNIHDDFFTAGTPHWVTIERAYKVLPSGTSFSCSLNCPSRLGLTQMIIDGTTVLDNWPLPPDPAHLTIGKIIFDQFMSTVGTNSLDMYYDDMIITGGADGSNAYETVIGAVSASASTTGRYVVVRRAVEIGVTVLALLWHARKILLAGVMLLVSLSTTGGAVLSQATARTTETIKQLPRTAAVTYLLWAEKKKQERKWPLR